MNEKKTGLQIILISFVIINCLSWLLWILLGKFVDSKNYENRTLAERPVLTIDSYVDFPTKYEEYYNDNIPFRNTLITLNSKIDYLIFKRPTNNRVVIGTQNWLFYNDIADGNPIGDYQGYNLYSDDDLKAITDNCLKMQRYFDNRGIEFVIFIAPNKERIYSEYMPQRYGTPTDTYRCLQLIEYLREHTNLRIVYPYNELINAKEKISQNIYYKTDTHWNWIGGYIGASALLSELGIQMPDINNNELKIVPNNNTAGDLAGMLNLVDFFKQYDFEYSVEGYDANNIQTINNDFDTTFIYHSDASDTRKIYVYRDSFSTNIAPYIGSQFADSYFRHRFTYSYDDLIKQNPDIFVYETVERYVNDLGTFSLTQ